MSKGQEEGEKSDRADDAEVLKHLAVPSSRNESSAYVLKIKKP
jgi:hypothetical protein